MTCLEFIEGETLNVYFMRCITPFREDPYPLPKCHVSWQHASAPRKDAQAHATKLLTCHVEVSLKMDCFRSVWKNPGLRKCIFINTYMDVSENSGFSPQIIHFDRVFHYKPSILGYHYFCKDQYTCFSLKKICFYIYYIIINFQLHMLH